MTLMGRGRKEEAEGVMIMAGTETVMEGGMVVEAMDMTTMEEAIATTMGTAGAMDMTMVMEKAEVRGQGPAALSRAPTVSVTTARYEIDDSMGMSMGMGMTVAYDLAAALETVQLSPPVIPLSITKIFIPV